jgi:hypothetical protein
METALAPLLKALTSAGALGTFEGKKQKNKKTKIIKNDKTAKFF